MVEPAQSGEGLRRVWLAPLALLLAATTAGAYVPRDPMPRRSVDAAKPATSVDVRDFKRLLVELDAKERQLTAELAASGPKLQMIRHRMIARGRAYYRLVKAGLLPVGGGFDALVDHATRVEQLRGALAADIKATERVETERVELEKKLRRVRAERAPLALQRQAFAQARSAMQQAEERRAAFQRAFGDSDKEPHVAIYGADSSSGLTRSVRSFRELRGRLSFPLAGRAELLTGPSPGRGITLLVSRNAQVRSVYAGQVSFTGDTDHGQTVVVDHGGGYYSLYGELQRVDVRRGDRVEERGEIAWVRREGDRDPKLYFELRRNKAILDASAWLGL
ncbi:MAG: peptidoglycan DD-metalloendopeptidase family protein [Polyangiaceae bacterium]